MLRATPRFPEEDSTRIDRGVSLPARSAAFTISAAGLALIDPAKLKPSHFRNSARPKLDRRSTYSSSTLNACGTEMTVTHPPRLPMKLLGRLPNIPWDLLNAPRRVAEYFFR